MIYCIGEMIIDLMQNGDVYIPYPGGAPANVAIHAKRSGADSKFVGKLSEDTFGSLLVDTLKANNVYYDLPFSDHPTTLAVVSHNLGERSFQFYRTNTADLSLDTSDIDTIVFNPKDILHLCSLGLVPEGTTYQAHIHAIERCKLNKGIISFDINLREKLWKNLDDAKVRCLNIINMVDIIKVNEEELAWLTNESDVKLGLHALQTNNQLVICTLGEEGSIALTSTGEIITYKQEPVKQIDTTGAGDSYIAMVLSSLSKSQIDLLSWQNKLLKNAMKLAANVSAQVVSKQGALPKVNY